MSDDSMTELVEALEAARAAGGVELEMYRQPGFTGGLAVRRAEFSAGGSGTYIGNPTDYENGDETPWGK